MSPAKQRREERLRLEAEALGMTLPEARLWWASQQEGWYTGRPALRERERKRLWAEGAPARAAAKAAREERTRNGTATTMDYVRNWYDAFSTHMQKSTEEHILYGSKPREVVIGTSEQTYENLKAGGLWPRPKTAQDYFLQMPEPDHVSLDVSKPYRPGPL
jgi:hypothetical protein